MQRGFTGSPFIPAPNGDDLPHVRKIILTGSLFLSLFSAHLQLIVIYNSLFILILTGAMFRRSFFPAKAGTIFFFIVRDKLASKNLNGYSI